MANDYCHLNAVGSGEKGNQKLQCGRIFTGGFSKGFMRVESLYFLLRDNLPPSSPLLSTNLFLSFLFTRTTITGDSRAHQFREK